MIFYFVHSADEKHRRGGVVEICEISDNPEVYMVKAKAITEIIDWTMINALTQKPRVIFYPGEVFRVKPHEVLEIKHELDYA